MYIQNNVTFENLVYIVENLCKEAIEELELLFGQSYKTDGLNFLKKIPSENIKLIRLKENNEAVAVFGIVAQDENSAGVFFLSTKNLLKGNMITFLKGTKSCIDEWNQGYKILLDSCCKKNKSVIKWLGFLGFVATNEEDENFQIYKKVQK